MKKHYLFPGILLSTHALAQTAPASDALPAGSRVIAGDAAIEQVGATLSIHQSSDRAAIDWTSFDVGSRATVQFLQPSASSVALNRVTDGNASQIFGRITANGQVFLSNPNGVYFAPGASVNVGGLVATTHGISVEDFMAGRAKFERNGATGSVINEGELTAALGGYVALLAPEVRNHGLVLANLGTVALAAGETFELQFDSNNTLANLRVEPSTIHALVENRSAVLAPGGLIILSAQAVDRVQGGVIRHSGVLEATGLSQRGGRIVLEGDDIALASGSRIDASGDMGGGEVLVGGDWQGKGDTYQAQRVAIDAGASIDVSAIQSGDGGTAVLWSDVQAAGGSTNVHGEINARGGAAGGNGGRIETSGHSIETDGVRVNAAAPLGTGGTWLIDPYSYSIGAPAAATISSALSNGTSVMVTTTADSSGFGSSGNVNDTGGIAVNSAITKSAGTDATLTLQAHRNVSINAPISSSVGRLNLVLWSDYANGNVAGVGVSGAISTNGGHVWIGGSSSNAGSSTWNGLTVGNGPSVGSVSANYNAMDISADIATSGGDVLLWAGQGVVDINSGPGIGLNGAHSINAGSGDVTLIANKVFNWQNGGALALTSTGLLTLAPSLGNAYDAAFDWTGTNTAGNFRLNNTLSANALTINSVAALGGLTIGRFADMSGVSIGNTSNVTVSSAIDSAGPVSIYGGLVSVQQSLNAAGAITLKASASDVLLDAAITNTAVSATALNIEAARHVRIGSNGSIAASNAAMTTQLWADTNADADGIVYLTSSGITTQGGSLTFGRDGQFASIGGATVRIGGDVFFQRGSAQLLDTGGGALNVYGETIVANTAGLTINTTNGAASFYGLLNSGNAYSFVDKTGSAGSGTWDAARIEARNGTAGASAVGDSYLVTVTSRLENAVAGLTANYRGSWIGAYRPVSTSYNWAWSDGPEGGQTFFTQTGGGGGTASVGAYANFGSGEPNGALNANRLSTETVGQFFGSAGLWNDLTHATAYAATQASQYAVLGFVRETNIAASPVIINAGTGAVTVQGGVGLSKALASLAVTSSTTTVNGNGLLTTGAQTYSGALAANAGGSNLLLQATSITAGGPVTATGADITLNANLASTGAGAAIELHASGNIASAAGRTLQTNNGNLTLWSDGDGNGAGYIALGNDSTLNSANGATAQLSGGGRITLAGGAAVDVAGLPTGSAASTTVHGVSLGSTSASTTTINSGGGDVLINGSTTTTSSTGDGTFHGLAGWGTLNLNAGQGAIALAGTSTDSYGLVLSRGGTGVSTLSSARASGTAINLTGATTAANTHGLVLDNNATEAILATGGGAIAITGTGTGTGYGVWLQGSRVLASSGDIVVNGGVGGINAAGSGNVLGKYSNDITTSSSNITLTGNRVTLAGATAIDTSGTLTVQPSGTSFSSAFSWPLTNLSLAPELSGLTLGKVGNTANISVASAQNIAGPISIYGGDITLDAGLQAGGGTITLQGSGNVTDGANGFVSALNLRLLGGNVTLDNAGNGVGYLAASGVGNLTYIDNDTLVLYSIGGTSGISATGVVNIATLVGDLSLLNDVSTTNSSNTALTLNAGSDANVGTASGGSLFIFNDAAVSVGAGGRARLFSGSVADSGLGVLVGSGSNRFRYNSDELATNYTLPLDTGLYAIYREQPTVALRINNQSMVYGSTVPARTFALDGARNGDSYAQSFTGAPSVSVGGATSTSSQYIAGGHALTGTTGSAASQLGYAVSPTVTAGLLTVASRALTVTYAGNDKTYDAALTTTVNGTDDRVAGDVLTIGATAAFVNANAGVGKTVNVTGIGASGTDAANYALDATSRSVTASITPRAVTVSGLVAENKAYDGTNVATLSNAGSVATGVGSQTLGLGTAGATFNDANAGNGKTVTATGFALLDGSNGGLAGNYSLTSTTAATTADISKAVLTVIANDDAKFVTRADAAGFGGSSFSGFVHGETAAVLTGAATVLRTNPGTNAAGVYADVLAPDVSGLSATNYSFVAQSGDYTIVSANQLLVQVANGSTGYGAQPGFTIGSAEYLDANASSVIALTDITNDGNGRFTVRDDAGGAASFTVSLTDASRTGAGFARAGAYQLAATDVTSLNAQNFSNQLTLTGSHDVTPRGISATAVAGVSKVYDGTSSMIGVQIGLTGAESADALSVSGTGEFSGRNAGSNLAYTIGGLTLGGDDAASYYLAGGTSFAGNNGAITPRTLIVNYAGVDKVYDGNTHASVSLTDNRIGGDALTISPLAAFADKNVGSGKLITIGSVTLDGADAGNYLVSAGGSSAADITRLDSVTWTGGASDNWFDPANWTGGAVPDLGNVANVILPAGVSVSFDTTRAVAPAQSGAVQLYSLGTAGNLAQNNGELLIGAGGVQLEGYIQTGGSTVVDGHFIVKGNFSQSDSGSVRVAGDTNITDTVGGTRVGNFTTGGDLNVTSTDGDITQAGGARIVVAGDSSLQAPGSVVTLHASGNFFGGEITVVDVSPMLPPVPPPPPPELGLPTPRTAPPMAGIGLMGISVALITVPSNDVAGLVAVDVPPGMTSTGFSFALPEEVTHDLPADTRITAAREDGGRLPAWLTWDAKRQRFVATRIPAHALPSRVAVTIGARRVTVAIMLAENSTVVGRTLLPK
jgi:filamentous hemagglutinin family protein